MYRLDLINGFPRGACGLSNDILDLGPDRLDLILGGSKNGEKLLTHQMFLVINPK